MKKSKKKEIAAKARESVHRLSFVDGNIHFILPALLLGALLVRILAFTNFSDSLYGDFLLWDERVYQTWASHILEGKLFVIHDFSPFPAYVMAAVYWLLGNDPDYVRAVNIIFGIFTCLFIYFIGRDLANRTVGLLACLIAALYKPFVFFSITILKESLGLFLFSATIFLFISLMKDMDASAVQGEKREDLPGKGYKKWIRSYGRTARIDYLYPSGHLLP